MQQKTNYYQPSKILIHQYPHFLTHKQEFFRKIKIPTELENKKDEIFNLIAMNKKKVIELMETIVEDNGNNLPIMRPLPSGLAERPALLDFTDYPEIFDEWLPEATP
ncbi:unnamed protein product [Rotaria socialis]|uniref:Uncharacterized protein n=1 Tax=Rotaria socialis TaxID=392032 RepID=A0A820TUN2_9BILA|nr:unnamed protein product [Rotaria socialis]